jgi:hypothetical protein
MRWRNKEGEMVVYRTIKIKRLYFYDMYQQHQLGNCTATNKHSAGIITNTSATMMHITSIPATNSTYALNKHSRNHTIDLNIAINV